MIEAGTRIGDRFEVEQLLGEGGLARVYRVRHLTLGSLHALKVLSLSHPSLRDRLLLEGRIQAQLRHPNLVRVTDVVEVEGQPGLLMEYVGYTNLARLLEEYGAMELDAALVLFAQVLAGVTAAHSAGVLHRDLKPANILLDQGPGGLLAKVADFGIAKVATEGLREGHTAQGLQLGTPGYMAPEQILSSTEVDQRADIFALGAILYEMVTGKRAFGPQHADFQTLSDTVEGRYLRIEAAIEACPETLSGTIKRALSVDPEERFGDCHAFAMALYADRPALVGGAVVSPPED